MNPRSIEPAVQYATTTDGVRIAYTATGEGPPHVFCNEPVGSHAQLAWSHSVMGRLLRELERHNTLICFDPRGSGMSDRILPSTLDEWVLDLEAVVARLGLKKFALSAAQTASPAAMTFAARHPGSFSRLVLVNGLAHPRDAVRTPPM